MKQLVAQAIVFTVLVAVTGFFVWLIRGRRSSLRAGREALESLAAELGTTYQASSQPRVEGALAGRRCRLLQTHRPASNDDTPFVHIEIACEAEATFELYRSKTGLVRIDPPDLVRTGDAEFDLQLEVRSSDAARAKAVLTDELRRQLLDWFRHGWVDSFRLKDRQLLIDGGFGFREEVEVQRARTLLLAGVEIAEGFEGRSSAG
ncbi:MAG: hypothetical protein AB7O28_17115 [Vicinamibacterales bacterium]